MQKNVKKMIKVNEDTYNRLSKQGIFHETFDDIIRKLLDFKEEGKNKK